MPEATPSHGNEGWGVHESAGFGLAAALYALAFLGCGAAAVMFAIYFPGHNARPWPQPYPQPRLNGRIDRDPAFGYGPKPLPAASIQPAMRSLAAQGEAGWALQGGGAPGRGPGR